MKRQTAILKTAQSQVRVLVDALAEQFNVSPTRPGATHAGSFQLSTAANLGIAQGTAKAL